MTVVLAGGVANHTTNAHAASAAIQLSSPWAPPTGQVSVSGVQGFTPGELVDLYVDSADATVATAQAGGSFPPTPVNIPTYAAPGVHWITATGRTSGASAQIQVWVSGGWPMSAADPTSEGYAPYENVLSRTTVAGLQPSFTGSGTGAANEPVAAFDTVRNTPVVVTTSSTGNVAVYDAQGCGSSTCAPLWKGTVGTNIAGSAAIADGMVFVAATNGTIAAFTLTGCGTATCSPKWTAAAGSAIDSAPIVATDTTGGRDLLLVGTDGGLVVAYDTQGCGSSTCSAVWSAKASGAVHGSLAEGTDPVLGEQLVFAGSTAYLNAFDLHTGARIWKRPRIIDAGTHPTFAPNVVAGLGIVFIVSGGSLEALKSSTGTLMWTSSDTAGNPLISSPTVSISRVFVYSGTKLYAYDAGSRHCKSCASIWRAPVTQPVGDPTVGDGVAYVASASGSVSAFSASGCLLLSGACTSLSSAATAPESGAASILNGSLLVPLAGGGVQVLSLANPPAPPAQPDPGSLSPIAGPIRHVVVIYQENHSFDNVLGYICANNLGGRCDGATTGKLANGTTIPLTQASDVVVNINHGQASQMIALDGGKMDGFSNIKGCLASENYQCYTQYHANQIPSLAALATNYVVSDRTFETMVTPTFGSHLLLATGGTMDGFTGDFPKLSPDFSPGPGWGCDSLLDGPWHSTPTANVQQVPSCVPDTDGSGPYKPSPVPSVPQTLMDRVDQAGLSWKIYEGAQVWSNGDVWTVCPTFAQCLFSTQSSNIQPATNVTDDAASGGLPNVSFVMPAPNGFAQHNGTSMMKGDNWISRVVSSIENGPDWDSTAIFITYDDCGCFYDHVPPPPGRGERVPMVIVSPYAKAAYTDSTPTGLVGMDSYIEHRFGLQPLTSDDATAYDYSNSFDYSQTPLAAVPLSQHAISNSVKQYLIKHPPPAVDPQ